MQKTREDKERDSQLATLEGVNIEECEIVDIKDITLTSAVAVLRCPSGQRQVPIDPRAYKKGDKVNVSI